MNNPIYIFWGVIMSVFILGVAFIYWPVNPSQNYDALAKCITNNGVKFYGSFWCSHCQNTKKAFGSSAKYLPYIECSSPDMKELQVCKDAGIKSYPTWIRVDGQSAIGELSIAEIAKFAQCTVDGALLTDNVASSSARQ